jgi:hypothetical protein
MWSWHPTGVPAFGVGFTSCLKTPFWVARINIKPLLLLVDILRGYLVLHPVVWKVPQKKKWRGAQNGDESFVPTMWCQWRPRSPHKSYVDIDVVRRENWLSFYNWDWLRLNRRWFEISFTTLLSWNVLGEYSKKTLSVSYWAWFWILNGIES